MSSLQVKKKLDSKPFETLQTLRSLILHELQVSLFLSIDLAGSENTTTVAAGSRAHWKAGARRAGASGQRPTCLVWPQRYEKMIKDSCAQKEQLPEAKRTSMACVCWCEMPPVPLVGACGLWQTCHPWRCNPTFVSCHIIQVHVESLPGAVGGWHCAGLCGSIFWGSMDHKEVRWFGHTLGLVAAEQFQNPTVDLYILQNPTA